MDVRVRLTEVLVAAVLGRLLIAAVTGETAATAFVPLVDWRWAFALPVAALLALMVEVVVNPDALE